MDLGGALHSSCALAPIAEPERREHPRAEKGTKSTLVRRLRCGLSVIACRLSPSLHAL
jgi:hypothetical protein